MIVFDASAIVLGLLNDGDARARLRVESVAVPHLADSEVANALRRQVLAGRVAADAGRAAIERWARFGVQRYAVPGLLPRVWELRDGFSAYDATYVALAEALECELLTADARLASAPGVACAVTVVRR